MGDAKGMRWPPEIQKAIEQAQIEDKRRKFSDEVFYLIELGLEEPKLAVPPLSAAARGLVASASKRRAYSMTVGPPGATGAAAWVRRYSMRAWT